MESSNGSRVVHVSTTLTPEEAKRLAEKAKAKHRSRAAEARVALLNHIEEEVA